MPVTSRIQTLLLGACACAALATLQAQDDALRTWTDTQGRQVQAAFGGIDGENVLLKLSTGQTIPYALTKLCPGDQEFVKSQAPPPRPEGAAAVSAGPTPFSLASAKRLPFEKRTLPPTIAIPAGAIEVQTVSENAAERSYIYRSQAFEFSSQAKLAGSVMKKVAGSFEGTRALIEALPWGLVCMPPEGLERYQAKLFETRDDYTRAGGPANSGGVYNSGTKVFMVPFPSIGLVKRGQTYFRDDNFRNDTLVHEITHQLMHDYLPFLPKWVIEGTAEYTELLPDKNDTGFLASQHERGLKDYIEEWEKRGEPAEIPSLQEHMNMTREQWDTIATSPTKMGQLYFRSALLVYYFNHLDGDDKTPGLRFMKYLDAVHQDVTAMHEFFANPAVKRSPDGRFSYPRSLTPPDYENGWSKHLPILIDGRTYEQLATEIRDKYRSKGIKVSVK